MYSWLFVIRDLTNVSLHWSLTFLSHAERLIRVRAVLLVVFFVLLGGFSVLDLAGLLLEGLLLL